MHKLHTAWQHLDEGGRWLSYRYVLAVIWAILFVRFTPASLTPFLSPAPVFIVWGIVAIAGVAGAAGVISNRHLTVEFPPLFGMVLGFTYYVLTQTIVSISTGTTDRLALVVLALIAASPYVERFVFLVPKFVARVRASRPAVEKAQARGRRKAGA
ncbi:hypothetical protein [Frigoribacterium sp. CFBP9030]|uniref:hypothetical protein n=1 Tax=Frigoribacterium sp. CFBP9030 TaxID=3096537 RepID=UPI002A6AE83C|nr:hypothetical protein [Frigoribacterium sp. CFBP9030]MDY0891891.1 hypothetical protein [Frigoribacterium sp. CFBP9030]